MKPSLAALLLITGLAGAAVNPQGQEQDLVLIVARGDGTHVATTFPVPQSDLRGGEALWVWSTRLPPRKLELRFAAGPSERILDELSRGSVHSLQVRLRGWSRREELATVRVIAAPLEMWASVPEALLPTFKVNDEGQIAIPVREAVRLRVIGRGVGTTWEQVGRSTRSVDIALRRPASDAELTFQWADRSAASRVFVTAMHARRADPGVAVQARFAADDRGRLRIPSLPAAEIVTLVITASRAAPQTMIGTAAELSRPVRMLAARSIRGKFVDEENKPIQGVLVETEAWVSSEAPAISGRHTRSDEKGLWVIDTLPRTHVVMRASAKGRGTVRKELALEEGDADLGVMRLPPSTAVQLEVRDSERRPLPNVNVTSASGFKEETNSDGVVAVDGLLPDEPATLTLSAKGFEQTTVSLQPPLPKRERVVMARAFTVTGKVAEDDSGAVPEGVMAIVTAGGSYRRMNIEPDGTFSFDLEPEKEFAVSFESPSTAPVSRKEPAGRPGELRDLGTIRLPGGTTVRGRVVDSAGEPVSGARIWVIRPSAAGVVASWVAGRVAQTNSDGEGKFGLRGVPSGPIVVRIDAPDFAPASRNAVADDPIVDLGTIEVVRGRTVHVDARADDAAVARLDLRGQWIDADMITAPVIDGAAHLLNVPPGQYTVTVLADHAVVCERRVRVEDGEDATVRCPSAVAVSGRVLLDGTPAYAGSLTWSRPSRSDALIDTKLSPFGARQQRVYGLSGGSVIVPVRADGTFETNALRPGEWQVAWRSTGGAATPDRVVEIPEAEEARVVVEFSGGVLRGRVLDGRDQPAAGARVREIEGPLFAIASPDGSFTMAGVPAGTHRLQAALGAKASPVVAVTVERGKQLPDLVLEIDDIDRNLLSVHVIGAGGEPKPNAFVFAEAMGGIRIFSADARGIATAAFPEGLPDGMRIIAFADHAWAFARLQRTGSQGDGTESAMVRFGETGALRIRSRTISGTPVILSAQGGNLTWMLERVGFMLSLTPDTPLFIKGLPPGPYTVSLGSATSAVSVAAGATPTADLP